MLSRILILVIALIVLPDTYILCAYVVRWTRRAPLRMLAFLPSAALLAYLLCVLANDDMQAEHQAAVGLFMIVFLLLAVPRTVFALLDALGWMAARAARAAAQRTRRSVSATAVRRVGRIVAMSAALCTVFILAYGYLAGRIHYVVHHQTFYFPNLPPAFDGYRVAHFSDLHIGTFADGHQADVADIVALVNRQHCDAVLFAGDLVNYQTRELDGYDSLLRQLHAPDGVYSVMGNHDYSMYRRALTPSERRADIAALQARERKYGWQLLLNDNRVIRRGSDSIAIAGVENDGRPPFPSLGNLPRATRGLHNVMVAEAGKKADHTFTILLSHDPTHWRRKVLPDTNIDLTLSGHTHAGQLKLFGWSPTANVYREWSGAYAEGAQILNVSEGIGMVMLPFRFGAWPEVNVIELRRTPARH